MRDLTNVFFVCQHCPFKKIIGLETPHMFTTIKDNDLKAALTALTVITAYYQKCD